jgi:hypothetical protein
MAEPSGGRKWLRCGCFGCLGIIVITIVTLLVLLVVARMKVRSEELEKPVLTPDLPAHEQPLDVETAGGGQIAVAGEGRVILDLKRGGFFIEPAAPGGPLRVEGRYDRRACDLQESLEQDAGDGWTYSVSFTCHEYSFIGMLKQMLGGSQPTLHIFLPADRPIALDLDVSQGGSIVELGGLWLTSAELTAEMGGIELNIEEPLKAPMDELKIDFSIGGGELRHLGNASPRKLDVDFKMGGMELDLRGLWLQDSDISIDGRMGGGAVILPDNVLIEGVDAGRLTVSEAAEIKPPTLRISSSIDQGELEFID